MGFDERTDPNTPRRVTAIRVRTQKRCLQMMGFTYSQPHALATSSLRVSCHWYNWAIDGGQVEKGQVHKTQAEKFHGGYDVGEEAS